MQEKVKEIYNKIKPEMAFLKEMAINKMYDDYFSKNEKTKDFIDLSKSREDGIRSLIGDSYFYTMMEENIILMLDEFMKENNTSNHKVPSWLDPTNSKLTLPNQPYHRFSQFDYYALNDKYANGEVSAYRVFDPKTGSGNQEDIEKIKSVIASLDLCKYLGFMAFDNGYFVEIYEFDDSIAYLFKCIFKSDKLEIVALEIWGDDSSVSC